jgi:hypothetical protein
MAASMEVKSGTSKPQNQLRDFMKNADGGERDVSFGGLALRKSSSATKKHIKHLQ